MSESVDIGTVRKGGFTSRFREDLLRLGEKVKILPERPPIMRGIEKPHSWMEKDFNVVQAIRRIDGPLVEIAGPTPSGYETVDTTNLDRPLLVSNIVPGWPEWDDDTGTPISYRDTISGAKVPYLYPVDLQADATKLPIAKDSVAAVFVRCLDKDLTIDALREAFRVIHDGGFFIGEHLTLDGIRYANSLGFRVKQYSGFLSTNGQTWWNYVLQKPNG